MIKSNKLVSPDKMFITKFGVAPSYEIKIQDDRRLICVSNFLEFWGTDKLEPVNFLYMVRPPKTLFYYNPTDIESMFTHFSAVEDEQSLLKFVHSFGLLGISSKKGAELFWTKRATQKMRFIPFDDIEASLKEAKTLRWALEEWANAQQGLPVSIGRNTLIEIATDEFPDYVEQLKTFNDVKLTKAIIGLIVSGKLSGVTPTANFDDSGNLLPGYFYFALVDAIWHSFYLSITGQTRFKRCPFCNSWHTGRGEYCPPPLIASRSLCENAHNQKKHRIRTKIKKMHHQGKTIEEISKTMKMEDEEILKIINRGNE